MGFKFGDKIENGWASEKNPRRVGVFVKYGRRTGRMNSGKYALITDMKGDLWESPVGEGHRLSVVGTVLATPTS